MSELGDAWVDVHANTKPFDDDLRKDLREQGKKADKLLDEVGRGWGKTVSKSTAEEIAKHGEDLAHAVEESTVGKKVRTRYTYVYDKEGVLKGFRKYVTEIESATTDALDRAFKSAVDRGSKPGGFFDSFTTGIRDAIGSGFNISGRSPLIVALIPVIGAIVGLVLAALQAINALVAVLVTVPALLAAIGLQAGVLFLVFKGLGTSISAAFAAKNAKELNAALANLMPSVRTFIKSLLPLKDLFTDLKKIAQENFFKAFGDGVTRLIKAFDLLFRSNTGPLAAALGGLFRSLALFFASPQFTQFVTTLFPMTIAFLNAFGPAFITFLSGLISLATAALPLLQSLGQMLAGNLESLGILFTDLAKDPATTKWLKDMELTLESVVELFGSAIEFVASFLDTLNKQGGKGIIDALSDALQQLASFFQSEAGQRGMKAFILLAILSIESLAGAIEIIFGVLGAIEAFSEFLHDDAGPAISDFFGGIAKAISDFFYGLYRFLSGAPAAVQGAAAAIGAKFKEFADKVGARIDDIVGFFRGLPQRIGQAIAGLGEMLYRKGANALGSFIDGIKSQLGPLGDAMGGVANRIGNFLGNSPAKEGPLSGSGWTEPRGRRLIRALDAGIRGETANLSNTMTHVAGSISLGSVNLNFYGQQPGERDARMMGDAAASQFVTRLAARETRLAIRTS